MREHIALTIADLKTGIAKFQEIIMVLEQMEGTEEPQAVMVVNAEAGKTTALREFARGNHNVSELPARVTRAKKSAGKKDRASELLNSSNVLNALSGLPEPISPKALCDATGITLKNAWNYLYRWKNKGWLRNIGQGSYVRTAKFPASGGATGREVAPAKPKPTTQPVTNGNGRVNVPGLDAPAKTLEQQLEDALKERDRARSAGQETLERIYQDRVDALQAKLDAKGA